jgi:nicrotizing toxin Mtb-like protein
MIRLRSLVCALTLAVATLAALTGAPGPATADVRPRAEPPGLCTGAYQHDVRLGPKHLPHRWQLPVGPLLLGYHRTGHLSPAAFLAKYWRAEPPGWIYPPDDGFARINGRLDKYPQLLRPGELLDRFGSEYGTFLAPIGALYSRRSLPPQNLVTRDPNYPCDYHRYRVTKAFVAWGGRIAAWFAQPGGGAQLQLDSAFLDPGPGQRLNVNWLLTHHYLARADS